MKFLVLALCVCAASAASFGQAPFGVPGYKNYNSYKNYEAPAVVAAKAVASVSAPVVAPVVQAASAVYPAAKQVINKAYEDSNAEIVNSESDVAPDGYKYKFETNNGIAVEAVGTTKQVGDTVAVVSQGSYKYFTPEGQPIEVIYTADENGFHPQSDALPVGPETPEPILRSLAYIAAQAALKKN